jgi:hypothetical protein
MSQLIPLTQGKFAVVDDADFALVSQYRWNAYLDRNTYYAKRNVPTVSGQRTQRMHALITGWPRVDHIDGDGLNNQHDNLRLATSQQNRRNSHGRRTASSRFKGVSLYRSGKWQAQIGVSPGVLRYLGQFASEIDAALAYDVAARDLFGEFARLNFPDQERS